MLNKRFTIELTADCRISIKEECSRNIFYFDEIVRVENNHTIYFGSNGVGSYSVPFSSINTAETNITDYIEDLNNQIAGCKFSGNGGGGNPITGDQTENGFLPSDYCLISDETQRVAIEVCNEEDGTFKEYRLHYIGSSLVETVSNLNSVKVCDISSEDNCKQWYNDFYADGADAKITPAFLIGQATLAGLTLPDGSNITGVKSVVVGVLAKGQRGNINGVLETATEAEVLATNGAGNVLLVGDSVTPYTSIEPDFCLNLTNGSIVRLQVNFN